jgi:hypothetical protein
VIKWAPYLFLHVVLAFKTQNTKLTLERRRQAKKITTDLSTDALLELRNSVIMLLLLSRHDRVLQISICKQQKH